MTDEERELVFRIGQCLWWLLRDTDEVNAMDSRRVRRSFIVRRLGDLLGNMQEKHGYELWDSPKDEEL